MPKSKWKVLNWDKVNPEKLFDPFKKDPVHTRQVMRALQAFIMAPGPFVPKEFAGNEQYMARHNEIKAAQAQHFSTLNDFPATTKEAIDKYHELAVYDNGYEQIFKMRDYTGSRRDGFAIDTITGGLSFRRIETGEKADVFQFSGAREYVFFDYYAGALGWDRKLFENQEWWQLEENAIEFRNEAFRIKAATYYALLEAVSAAKGGGAADVVWAAAPDTLAVGTRGYLAQRDAQTINNACQTILLAVQASGYGVSAQNVAFKILAPIQLRARIKQALAVNYDISVPGPQVLDYRVDPIITTMLNVTDHYWVILPGHKIVAGDRMELTTYADFDILSRTDTAAGWMAFGGAVADIAQMERCNIA